MKKDETDLVRDFKHYNDANRKIGGKKCHVCDLSPEYLEAVNQLLKEDQSAKAISRWLVTRGLKVGSGSLCGHKRKSHHNRPLNQS